MRRVIRISAVIIVGVAIAGGVAVAQEPTRQEASKPRVAPSPEQAREVELKLQKLQTEMRDMIAAKQRAIVEMETQKALDQVKIFGATSGMLGGVVTGAPYSATTVNESIQTLADGNRIVNKHTGLVARDSDGRIRREGTMGRIGPLQLGGLSMIMIHDPVAKTATMMTAALVTTPAVVVMPCATASRVDMPRSNISRTRLRMKTW